MSKVAHYLQEHLVGEVFASTDIRHHFAGDGSILQIPPALVVYPRNENDVRKTARFSWQLAERGRTIPLTARGYGSDTSGSAIGPGMVLAFTAHMNRILELDTKNRKVNVEPGINYGKLQQALHTHGLFLPPYPPSIEYSSIGGALANNAAGEKSLKYGDTKAYLNSIRAVLANGEVAVIKRLSKKELSKKLGLATFEGEIYRSIDTLIEEQHDLILNLARQTITNNAGYDLLNVKHKDGSFDLSPLIIGSQGTLALITEAEMNLANYNPETSLFLASFDSLERLQEAVIELQGLSDKPSALEMVDQFALEQVYKINPNLIKAVLTPPFPPFSVLVEFETLERNSKKATKQAEKILNNLAASYQVSMDPEEQIGFWKVRHSVNSLIAHNDGLIHALPLFNGSVPPERLREYLDGLYELISINNLKPALWGHLGLINLSLMPNLNLGQVGDRQKAFRLLDQYHDLILKLNGTISATSGEGRLRAPYLENMYGPQLLSLLQKVKKIFDPYNLLNPGVKLGTTIDDLKASVRSEYGYDHIYNHLPRS